MIKIPLKMISLKSQRVTHQYDCFYELYPDRLRFFCKFEADEPKSEEDETLGWQNNLNHFDCWVKKTNIAGCELTHTINPSRYCILIAVMGFGSDLKFYFKTYDDAKIIFDQVVNFIFDKHDSSSNT